MHDRASNGIEFPFGAHEREGMHHCYALQYSVPECKSAFNEIMKLIKKHFGS